MTTTTTGSLSRRTPEMIALMKRKERALGVELTCRDCGQVARCSVDTRTGLPTLNGDAEYGRCDGCTTLDGGRGRGEFVRSVVARLLEVDVDNLALDGLRVDQFSERPSARPDRPNPEPWSHVALDALAGQYRDNEQVLHQRYGGPCDFCGTTLTDAGAGWSKASGRTGLYPTIELQRRGEAERGATQCEGCRWWFEERWGGVGKGDRRSTAAAALCGILVHGGTLADLPRELQVGVASPYRLPLANFGTLVGLRFWSETGLTEGATRPWAHIDIGELRRHAVDVIREHGGSYVASEFPIVVDDTRPIAW